MNRLIALPLACLALFGCARNAVLMPNDDASLNKPAKAFAEDAARHFPYPARLERGGELPARAEVGYMVNVIRLVNYSKQDWTDVELWVNRRYVLPLARLEANNGQTKSLPFALFYDDAGERFPDDGARIDTLELKLNGKLYDVPKQLGG